jgi:hypothetical protein
MGLDKKIIEELRRFNDINRYVLNEQAPPPPPPAGDEPLAGDVPPPPPAGEEPAAPDAAAATPPATEVPEPVDVANDPDVEEVGKEEGDEETEEIDITDLVNTQQEMKDSQDTFMDDIFTRLDDLQSKLENMDQIMNKISSLETKFDRYRQKTPEEKLMLRSLDSYPYNQKLTDFFEDKQDEMEETGKNEYVLTSDDVENFSPNEVKKTFNIFDDEEEGM